MGEAREIFHGMAFFFVLTGLLAWATIGTSTVLLGLLTALIPLSVCADALDR